MFCVSFCEKRKPDHREPQKQYAGSLYNAMKMRSNKHQGKAEWKGK